MAAADTSTNTPPTSPGHLPTEEQVMGLLRGVIDPELGLDIVELGMAQGARIEPDGVVHVGVALTTSGCPLRAQIQKDVLARVGSLPGVDEGEDRLERAHPGGEGQRRWTGRGATSPSVPSRPRCRLTTKVVMVASGKGGVGKSSVTVNLGCALAARGLHGRDPGRRHLGLLGAADARHRRSPRSRSDGRGEEPTDPSPRDGDGVRSLRSCRWASSSTRRAPRSCGAA